MAKLNLLSFGKFIQDLDIVDTEVVFYRELLQTLKIIAFFTKESREVIVSEL
jgi:hypothetical protein